MSVLFMELSNKEANMAAIKHIAGEEVFVEEAVDGLTRDQLERQDYVDNAIYDLVCQLNVRESKIVNRRPKWDMEFISWIRIEIYRYIHTYNPDHTEMEFYPYMENEDEETMESNCA